MPATALSQLILFPLAFSSYLVKHIHGLSGDDKEVSRRA